MRALFKGLAETTILEIGIFCWTRCWCNLTASTVYPYILVLAPAPNEGVSAEALYPHVTLKRDDTRCIYSDVPRRFPDDATMGTGNTEIREYKASLRISFCE
jgi:hypothetical protein